MAVLKVPIRLRRNVAMTYCSQIYVSVVSVVVIPIYLRMLGAESFGLYAFYSLLVTWSQYLDLGMSGTLSRQSSRYLAGALTASELTALFNALEVVFGVVAVLLMFSLVIASPDIGSHWLNIVTTPRMQATFAIVLIGVAVPIRWMASPYRALISGFEHLSWLAFFNATIATIRFLGVLPVLAHVNNSISTFLWFQIAVSAFELLLLGAMAYRVAPRATARPARAEQFTALGKSASFSFSLSAATITWLLIGQTDRFLLTTRLTLADYGHLALVFSLAGAITLLCSPIGLAVLPRLTRLVAEDTGDSFIPLYRGSTQLLCVIAAPLSMTLAFFGKEVLLAWTGNVDLARTLTPVLRLYALGNGVLAVAAMPYVLQFAKGDLRLHVVGTTLLAAIVLPSMFFAIDFYGAVGAGACWLGAMVLYLVLWTPLAHKKFAAGIAFPWLARDVGAVALPALVVLAGSALWVSLPSNRCLLALALLALFLVSALASATASTFVRSLIRQTYISLRSQAQPL